MTCKHLLQGAPDCVFCERDELRAEVQRLQRALHFWLPGVPASGPEEIAQRCGDDAMLLVGYDPTDPVELDAEARGWIKLQESPGHPTGDYQPRPK